MMSPSFFLLLLVPIQAQEVATPSSLLNPRNYNPHAFNAGQFLRELSSPDATKQGPVLFPNDAPPPPRPPLIVTSRPLLESIARSELGNRSPPLSSPPSHVARPFLARVREYRPFQYVTASPASFSGAVDQGYEEKPTLPPIYKVLSQHAKQKLQDIQRQTKKKHYQVKEPDYIDYYKNRNVVRHDSRDDGDQNKNYAFSYRVNDKKTGDDFSHSQHSFGSATNGEYRVRLPDGRMQIVSYTADENGYQANVRYDDEDKTVGNRIENHGTEQLNYDQIDHNYDKTVGNKIDNHRTEQLNYDQADHDYINNKLNYNDYSQVYSNKQDVERKSESGDFKTETNNDYYADLSKEYYNDDFSSEFESKNYDYAPHRSKYAAFVNSNSDLSVPQTNFASSTAVTPTYDELKDLLVTKKAYNTIQPYVSNIPVEVNAPSTTPSTFDVTTERVVVIGGKKPNLYTSVTNSYPFVNSAPISVTPAPIKYNSNFAVSVTPSSYLASTIASLRNRVDLSGPTPVLSQSYIDRINKYLRFK